MKRLLPLLGLLFAASTSAFAQHPVIQQIINEVNLDSLMLYSEEITGERGVTINGVTDTIISRHKNNPGNDLTVDYIEMKLNQFGLTPVRQTFSGTGENIYAELPGLVYPNEKYVICAHFDAVPGSGPAPAADDDGSGTAALIEIARILADYEFEYTIVFGFWDEEEQGLVGSDYYAVNAASNNVDLKGVFNMDAIAWDGDGDDLMRVHTRPTANSESLADTVVAMNTTYNIGLNIAVNNPGATYSDHASFWNENYSAVLIIEDFDNDGNPHYHTPTDLVQYFDQPYFHMMSELSIASVASCAIPYDPLSSSEEQVLDLSEFKVYPNPFSAIVNLSFQLENAGNVDLLVWNAMGQLVDQVELNNRRAGKHAVQWDGRNYPAGLYHFGLSVNNQPTGATQTVLKAD